MSAALRPVLPLADEAATEQLGARFAQAFLRTPALRAQPCIVYLRGELGAGKTCFARGLIHALDAGERVRSPTYTLVERHVVAGVAVLHLDLYRLIDADQLEPLALREQMEPGTLWLIEWPERARGRLPPADLTLRFEIAPQGHRVMIESAPGPGSAWFAAAQKIAQEEGVST